EPALGVTGARRASYVQRTEEIRVRERSGIVLEVGMAVQRRPDLPDVPALYQTHLGLRYVAARQLVEQRQRRHPLGQLVTAGLDTLRPAQTAREQLEAPRANRDAGLLEKLRSAAQARTGRHIEPHRQRRERNRPEHIPGCIACSQERSDDPEQE